MYLNKETKENLLGLMVTFDMFFRRLLEHESKMKSIFGPGWKLLKSARGFIRRAYRHMEDEIGLEEAEKIYKLQHHINIAIIGRYAPKKDEASIPVDPVALQDLSELAMGQQCTGCSKCNWKECRLFQVLRRADIPAAQEVKNDCPYRQ